MAIIQIEDTYINVDRLDYIRIDHRNERYEIYIGGQPQPVRISMGSNEWNRLQAVLDLTE
jgi:hypothetical protein